MSGPRLSEAAKEERSRTIEHEIRTHKHSPFNNINLSWGAATQVWCATSPRINGLGGVYCENVEIARVVPPDERSGWASDDSSRKVGVMPHAIDPVSAERLWSVSVEMTGESAQP
jgi:hypothetical protein